MVQADKEWHKKVVAPVVARLRSLPQRLGEGIRFVPAIIRKPAIVRTWLLTARAAQVTLVLAVLFVPLLLPRVIDPVLEKMYPPVKQEKLFGLVQTSYENPRLEPRKVQARTVLWLLSGGAVLLLLVLRIPEAVRSAEDLSRKHERKADRLMASQPSKSVILYRTALGLVSEEKREKELQEKIGLLDERLSRATSRDREAQGISDSTIDDTVAEKHSNGEASESTVRLSPVPSGIGPGGRYRFESEIGRGAMGVVYRAHDTLLERDVALKELPSALMHDKDSVERFQQEARTLARLTHPNIIQVYDYVEDKGRFWIAMELIDGRELDEILREASPVTVPEAAKTGFQIAEAMAYAHSMGVIHRDLKPSNVMITSRNVAKITDFGIAKLARSSGITMAGTILGSPAYMSPEQAAGKEADARADVYALGIILYRMVTGNVPFEGDTERVLTQQITQKPTPPRIIVSEIPPKLEKLILSMLIKDPEKRTQGMSGVDAALKPFFKD